ncbi:MAG: Vms1/Ankzf1 family peptidyl-tRNA hydrolase [Marmoricola sp.]
MASTSEVVVPLDRLTRWVENFGARHGATALLVTDGALRGAAEDGSSFAASLPFSRPYVGPVDLAAFLEAAAPPDDWGILLVRKGGFAVARLHGTGFTESKTGQRHVQGVRKCVV